MVGEEGEPTAEELANENLIKIVAQRCTDEQVNTLLWKCLGEIGGGGGGGLEGAMVGCRLDGGGGERSERSSGETLCFGSVYTSFSDP